MIPAPPQGKPIAFYDTECYINFWLLKIESAAGVLWSFPVYEGQTLTQIQISQIVKLFDMFTVVSFNGIYYDVPMIAAALGGFDTYQLKNLSDEIIIRETKPWELNLPIRWEPRDHIDIIEVLPAEGSQKQYAARIHCRTIRDLPYNENSVLTADEIHEVDLYCGNDLSNLRELFNGCSDFLFQREKLSERYGIDLRSKSDAQLAEAVLKHRCEQELGYRIYKEPVDWNLKFRFDPPAFLRYELPQLRLAFDAVKNAIFTIAASGKVEMPHQLAELEIHIGSTVYKMGIGGLHSKDKGGVYRTTDTHLVRDIDVESYYPSLILNSGKWPKALGSAFLREFAAIKTERVAAKKLQSDLDKQGIKDARFAAARSENEGGKIMLNGTFGKTGSSYSILWAPEMMIQTTVSGQLSILMLIEWLESYGISVVSSNTDGVLINCPRHLIETSQQIIKQWEAATGLKMEITDYAAIYARDVNNYFAIKADGKVKRKGQYNVAGLIEKKNPNVEICSDAVAEYLSKGTPVLYTIATCKDIRKFVTVRQVNGGAVKLWGEGPNKDLKVNEIVPILQAHGWTKVKTRYARGNDQNLLARDAYRKCFAPQRPEYVGKVIRWYYSTNAPGSIIYNTNGNTVGLSYGAKPCMTFPDQFPTDIDYDWYLKNCEQILKDVHA